MGFEPTINGFAIRHPLSVSIGKMQTCGKPAAALALPLAHADRKSEVADPELARVIESWPTLPEHIRAAVLALIQTAQPAVGPPVRRGR